MDEELAFFLKLIAETDGAVEGPASRKAPTKMDRKQWDDFCNLVKRKKVKATMVIDFQYRPKNSRPTVERSYCFDDGGTNRVVLHVHTLDPWPTGSKLDPTGIKAVKTGDPRKRAREVTSVNIRYAPTSTNPNNNAKFEQESGAYGLVWVDGWETMVNLGRGEHGANVAWNWSTPGVHATVPPAEKMVGPPWGPPWKSRALPAGRQQRYDQVREVIQLGEKLLQGWNLTTVNQHTVAASWPETNGAFRCGGATFAVYVPAGSGGTAPHSLLWAKTALFLSANALFSGTIMLLLQRQQRRPRRRLWGLAAAWVAWAACGLWWRARRAERSTPKLQ
ncbi:hypothetical protein T484DRAFT_2027600 [Baffinella frigidus]|nr:hypothetical protein T484DRAFT_2027600 [Cryptophyta sp. CCMP2293]